MIALLIHFLGFLFVDSAIPHYIESADAYFLARWYAAFAAIDLIAIGFSSTRLRIILALSFAWSAALSFECAMLQDTLQRNDQIVQHLLDAVLFGYFILLLYRSKVSNRRINATK